MEILPNLRCYFVSITGLRPFNRCQYCEKRARECFGFQFFFIALSIIALLVTTFFISDLPALVLDIIIVIMVLIGLLSLVASRETNEIIYNNVLLAKLNRELEEKVSQRTAELKEFIGIINHEMKTPLTAIISATEFIDLHARDRLEPSPLKFLRLAKKNSIDLLHLTEEMLDLSKIEAGKIEIYKGKLDIPKLAEEITDALRIKAEEKQVIFKTAIDPAAAVFNADAHRFRQVLFNLLDNAVKYSPQGGTVELKAQLVNRESGIAVPAARLPQSSNLGGQGRQVDRTNHEPLTTNHVIQITITDQGIGIKAENLGSIFEKFAQRAPGYKGTGLGLHIAKSFVEAHGGSIAARSEYGKGATFTVSIPA